MNKKTRQLEELVESALNTHQSLTEIENEEYARNTRERHKNRIKFSPQGDWITR
jgi:hypothetical protein